MKKLTMIISLCLALGIGFCQASAQQSYSVWYTSGYSAPIECNGVEVDVLSNGTVSVHAVIHTNWPKTGIWRNVQMKGTAVSSKTGEVFTVKETAKFYFNGEMWVYTGKVNLKGDEGTHYIGYFTFDFENDWELLDIKLKCK